MCVKGYISFNVFLVILTCVILGPQILFAGSQCCTSANLVHLRVLESGNGFNGQREEMENLFLRKTRRNVTQNIFYTHTHTQTQIPR